MKGPTIKPLSEMVTDLDEETRKTEEWRKAQGLPKTNYQRAYDRILADLIDGGEAADDEVDK